VQQIILDSLAAGVFTVDRDFRLTSFNREAERVTGIAREHAIGRFWSDVVRASDAENDCALEHSLQTGESVVNKAVYLVDVHARRVPISITTAILKDAEGNVIGAVESFRDLTLVEELKRRVHEKYIFEDIVGRSAAMQDVFALLPILAESDTTALIEGPSGTGKELVARAIVSLSCASLSRPCATVAKTSCCSSITSSVTSTASSTGISWACPTMRAQRF
jgi:PAS domain S-box-containing protein